MTFFEKLRFRLGIGNHRFDSSIWKKIPKKRKLFVKDIIESQIAVGMTKEQLTQFFGSDKREYTNDVWGYTVSTFRKGEIKDMLCFYFDRDSIVNNIRTKYRKKLR